MQKPEINKSVQVKKKNVYENHFPFINFEREGMLSKSPQPPFKKHKQSFIC